MPTRYKIATQDRAETFTNKTIGTTNLLSFNAPQGFLINGKIVPSVATDDLTVAIKGLDGNDPSATNPVYCRIGDTIRSITSALTVTILDATNWFNAGSAALATKEIDYFVYLGWESAGGALKVLFSRVSHATIREDFSGTTTNEKYAAGHGDLNAGDDVELVGRFAATLSAGAGYTWSVPTFTNKNLIQRPINCTRDLTYLPLLATGAGALANITYPVAVYKLVDNQLTVINQTDFDLGTATSAYFSLTIPFSGAYVTGAGGELYTGSVATYIGVHAVVSGGAIYYRRYDGANFAIATAQNMRTSITTFI